MKTNLRFALLIACIGLSSLACATPGGVLRLEPAGDCAQAKSPQAQQQAPCPSSREMDPEVYWLRLQGVRTL